jgi:hypothetical protein
VVWFKVDDSFTDHPKVAAAGKAALALWVRAGPWSARHLTDGYVPAHMLSTFGGNRAAANALVKAGLWTAEPDGGYRFHDWDQYNPSRAKVEADREATADRVRKWRERQQE